MNSAIERLRAADYNELRQLYDEVFSGNPDSGYLERALPKMWRQDDAHMEKHLAIRENGKLAAVVGIYPYETVVTGEKMLFATVGNVATMPFAREKGYMRKLMTEAMAQLEQQGVAVSRLGGLRSRYNRYGYECAGQLYAMTVTQRNAKEYLSSRTARDIGFRPVREEDVQILAQVRELYEGSMIHVRRGSNTDFYDTLRAWDSGVYAAFDGPDFVGYLCVSADGSRIPELGAIREADAAGILCRWLEHTGKEQVQVDCRPWEKSLARDLGSFCENVEVRHASQFKILRWDMLTGALLRWKAQQRRLPEGELTLEIKGWGSLQLSVEGQSAVCRRTQQTGEISLDPVTATRLLFGTLEPALCVPLPPEKQILMDAWLPLPLSWNDQDRV